MKCKIKDNFLRKKKKENGHYIQYTDTKNKKKMNCVSAQMAEKMAAII